MVDLIDVKEFDKGGCNATKTEQVGIGLNPTLQFGRINLLQKEVTIFC